MDLIGELVISESVVLQNPDLKVPGLRLDNFNKVKGTDVKNIYRSSECHNVDAYGASYKYIPEDEQNSI